jgi:hypothetical protein
MWLRRELREHGRLFLQEARPVIGAEGLLGVVALFEFIRSFVEPPVHFVIVHGQIVEHRSLIHPSWGWLCIVLGVALFAEARVVHRLIRAHGPEPELIHLSPKQLADYTTALGPSQERES